MPLATNRKYTRQGFSAILKGTPVPVQRVFDGQVEDFGGQSPVIVLASGGTNREQAAVGSMTPTHLINLFVFVLYKDEKGTWSELDAENQLDDLEYEVSQIIAANQVGPYWEGHFLCPTLGN